METNENIIEETPIVDTPVVEENKDSVVETPSDNPSEVIPPVENEEVKTDADILSSLISLALTGYEMYDIIPFYGHYAGWDAETVKTAIITYGHDFGQFLMDEGLIDSEVEKKFLNYTMHYHIVDSLERLGKVDFNQTYDEFKEWIITWAETKNYQSVLDALNTIGGKEVVSVSTIEGIASVDASKALFADGVVFEMGGKVTSVKAASIALNNSKIVSEINGKKGNTITLNAVENISIQNLSMEGEYPTKTAQLIIQTNATINEEPAVLNIDGSSFAASGYNAINIGSGAKDCNYKEINITNCDFTSVLENNAINIYGCAEGGVINIKNCTFDGCMSNPIRFFNSSNVHATINVENCVFKQWQLEYPRYTGVNEEYGYDYAYCCAGMIIFEDHLSGSHEAEMENKKFTKVTLNITNCTGPFGKITAPKKLSDICCSMNKNQVICISYWETPVGNDDNGEPVWYLGYAGFEDHFPTINIR